MIKWGRDYEEFPTWERRPTCSTCCSNTWENSQQNGHSNSCNRRWKEYQDTGNPQWPTIKLGPVTAAEIVSDEEEKDKIEEEDEEEADEQEARRRRDCFCGFDYAYAEKTTFYAMLYGYSALPVRRWIVPCQDRIPSLEQLLAEDPEKFRQQYQGIATGRIRCSSPYHIHYTVGKRPSNLKEVGRKYLMAGRDLKRYVIMTITPGGSPMQIIGRRGPDPHAIIHTLLTTPDLRSKICPDRLYLLEIGTDYGYGQGINTNTRRIIIDEPQPCWHLE